MKHFISIFLLVLGVVGGYVFPLNTKEVIREIPGETIIREVPALGVALPQTVAVFETSLASPISSAATSLTLTANSVRGGTTLSGHNCFTIDEGSAQAEFVCGTVSGTAVSSLSRGIDPATGTSTAASLQFAHRRGANVKITDFPVITIMRNQLNGSDTIPNALKYAITIKDSDITSATTSLVSYNLLSNSLAAGTVDGSEIVKGIWEGATALEQASSTILGATGAGALLQSRYATDTPQSGCAVGYTSTAGAGCVPVLTLLGKIRQTMLDIFTTANTWTQAQIFSEAVTHNATTTAASGVKTLGTNLFYTALASTTITGTATPQPVYATTSGALILSDANVNNDSQFLGFAVSSALNGASTTVQIEGIVPGFSGLTRGSRYYVQDAVGTIGTTVGTNEVVVGVAVSTTEVLIQKSDAWGYIGSVATVQSYGATTGCMATATSSPVANKFIFNGGAAGSGTTIWDSVGQTIFMRYGATTASISARVTDSGPAVSTMGFSIVFTPSTNVMVLTGGNTNNQGAQTCSGTLYMYR